VKRTRRKSLQIGGEHAAQALHMLVSEGRVAAREVYAVLKRREKLLRDLRARLAALGVDGLKVVARVRRGSANRAGRKAGRKAKRRISAATRAAWAAQGRYMAAVRRLPKAARVKIKAIREKSGVKAAVAAAKRMAR
jgi:hypothetical protein